MSAGADDAPARIGDLVIPQNMAQVLVQLSITLAIGVLIVGKVFNALPAAAGAYRGGGPSRGAHGYGVRARSSFAYRRYSGGGNLDGEEDIIIVTTRPTSSPTGTSRTSNSIVRGRIQPPGGRERRRPLSSMGKYR